MVPSLSPTVLPERKTRDEARAYLIRKIAVEPPEPPLGVGDQVAERIPAMSESKTQYVVLESTPGYLSEDDDPATFEDLSEARIYASDRLSQLLDFIYEGQDAANDHAGWTVDGSFQTDLSVIVYDKPRTHDLGCIIEIIPTEGDEL